MGAAETHAPPAMSCVLHTHRERREHRKHREYREHREHGHVPRWGRASEGDAGTRVYRWPPLASLAVDVAWGRVPTWKNYVGSLWCVAAVEFLACSF